MKKLILILVLIVVIAVAIMIGYDHAIPASNFDECVAEGNPVMESYPRQCRSKDGKLFVEDITPEQV